MSRAFSVSFWSDVTRKRFGFGIIALFLPLFCSPLFADSTYEFTLDNEPYVMLTGGTSLGIPPSDQVVGIDLEGEWVPLYGRRFYPSADTPLVVFGVGLLRLDNPGYSVAIDALFMELTPFDERSDVRYQFAKADNESVLKLEWRYAGILDTPDVADDYVNFQIWIYQGTGIVELRYGPSKLAGDYGETVGGGPFAGLFRSAPWDAFKVLQKDWLTDDPTNPHFIWLGEALPRLGGVPPEGTVYRFTPRASSGIAETTDRDGGYRLYPNPTSGTVTIEASKGSGGNARVRLIDLLGKTVDEYVMGVSASILEIDLPYSGVYYCEIIGQDGTRRVYSVVRQ